MGAPGAVLACVLALAASTAAMGDDATCDAAACELPRHSRYSSVVFDLGGVLVDWNPHAIASRMFAAEAEPAHVAAVAAATRHAAWKAYNAGAVGVDGLLDALGPDVDRNLMRRFATDYSSHTPTLPGGLRALERVRARGYRTYVLSNYPQGPFEALLAAHREGWMGAFDGMTVSYAAGCTKPSRAIYDRFFADAQLRPSECLFIDDKPENVEAARAVGMDAIVCDDPAALVDALVKAGVL